MSRKWLVLLFVVLVALALCLGAAPALAAGRLFSGGLRATGAPVRGGDPFIFDEPPLEDVVGGSGVVLGRVGRFHDKIQGWGARYRIPFPYQEMHVDPLVSGYSSIMPWHYYSFINHFTDAILSFSKPPTKFLDITGHVGVESLVLVKEFGMAVDAVEIDREYANMFRENSRQLAMGDLVDVEDGDGAAAIKNRDLSQYDFIYADPPWGGRSYKSHKTMELKLGNKHLHQLIDTAFSRGAAAFVLKAPKNYVSDKLEKVVKKHGKRIAARCVLGAPECPMPMYRSFMLYFCT